MMESAASALSLHIAEQFFNERQNEAHIPGHEEEGTSTAAFFSWFYNRFLPFVKQAIYLTFIGISLFCTSVVLYGVLYWLVMPPHHAKEPVYFDYNRYRSCNGDNNRAEASFFEMCSSFEPTASDLTREPAAGQPIDLPECVSAEEEVKSLSNVNDDLRNHRIILDDSMEAIDLDALENHSNPKNDINPPQRLKQDERLSQSNINCQEKEHSQEHCHYSKTQPHKKPSKLCSCPPTATVSLISTHTQWQAHTPEVAPPPIFQHNEQQKETSKSSSTLSSSFIFYHPSNALFQNRKLKPFTNYFIQVALTLHDSAINRNLGMFMVDVNLLDHNNERLASSSRSSMLPYESSYVSGIRKTLLMGPLLMGAVPEAKTIVIDMFDHYVESLDRPTTTVNIQLIGPNFAKFLSNGQSIQVLSAELRIGKELNIIQFIMREWFYSCLFLGILFFMVCQAAGLFLVQAWYDLYQQQQRQEQSQRDFHPPPPPCSHPNHGRNEQSRNTESNGNRSEQGDGYNDYDSSSSGDWESTNHQHEDTNRGDTADGESNDGEETEIPNIFTEEEETESMPMKRKEGPIHKNGSFDVFAESVSIRDAMTKRSRLSDNKQELINNISGEITESSEGEDEGTVKDEGVLNDEANHKK